jgi:hypothetical protein
MDIRLFLFALVLGGCGGSDDAPKVSRGTYLSTVSAPLCERFKACSPNTFAKTYDGGVPQCTTEFSKTSSPDDATKCSQAQLDTCLGTVKNSPCESLGYEPTQATTTCKTCF